MEEMALASRTMEVLAQLALIAFPFLLAVVAYFVQRLITDVKAQLVTDAASRSQMHKDIQASVSKESSARLVAIETVRNEIDALRNVVHLLQREVDKDYVNFERLDAIMRPLQASFDQLSRDLKEGQSQLFKLIDGKVDKT